MSPRKGKEGRIKPAMSQRSEDMPEWVGVTVPEGTGNARGIVAEGV